jgi:hypothetical protein
MCISPQVDDQKESYMCIQYHLVFHKIPAILDVNAHWHMGSVPLSVTLGI